MSEIAETLSGGGRVGKSPLLAPLEWEPEIIQLKGFSRGVAEIQWLLVALVLLYLLLATEESAIPLFPALAATAAYFLFSLGMNYLDLSRVSQRWQIAVHTWVMTAFITWLLYAVDGIDSPLVSLYLLAVITSALALGRTATVLQVGVVAACYLMLLYHLRGEAAFAAQEAAIVASHVFMFLLVGYLTSVLTEAIHYANARRVMAHKDQLTGLYNRMILDLIIQPMFAGAVRQRRSFSVLLIDMDNLKEINDGYGHNAGDQALIACAQILRSAVRASDVVARYGGDEFVAFLPDTDSEGARTAAWRIIRAARGAYSPGGRLSVSIGVASFPRHGQTIEQLLDRADRAMYDIKRAGGDSVAVAEQSAEACMENG
jgi:diguanylate cyclase (GGDEF)-like protein